MKIGECEFSDALLYDVENRTWAKQEGSVVKVGITSLLSWATGPIFSVTFKPVGTEVRGIVTAWLSEQGYLTKGGIKERQEKVRTMRLTYWTPCSLLWWT